MYQELEKEYADFVGSKYAVAVSSGTAALHVALVALGIGEGDEVIVPDFTMAACGFAVAYTGAKVVTVDCNEQYLIDPELIEAKITKKTKAIMPVHIYGRICDMQAIMKIAKKHNLKVIEDACEAQGAVYNSQADVTCYSFYRNKIIAAEEGGIVCTNDEKLAENIRDLKNMAFGDKHDYFHNRIGFNYRMSDGQAKLVLKSLKKYPENLQKRKDFEKAWQMLRPTLPRDAVWVYDFLCQDEYEKAQVIKDLNVRRITWRHFFKPLSTMPMFKQEVGKHALDYSKRGLYICLP